MGQTPSRGMSSLDVRLAEIDREDDDDFERTPSVQCDLDAGLDERQASRQARLRRQLRSIDAELAVVRAQLERSNQLREPSNARLVCDGECMVGGCGNEFSAQDGVLCEDCQLFLCFQCFGATVVANECAVGGRYDAEIRPETTLYSPAGSLPCPLYPQGCTRGHIPLVQIQRALLHRSNRGRDGEHEDVTSKGHSPHKLHLLARRRIFEAQLPENLEDSFFDGTLMRTVTEARAISAVSMGAELARTHSSTRSHAC